MTREMYGHYFTRTSGTLSGRVHAITFFFFLKDKDIAICCISVSNNHSSKIPSLPGS